MCKCIKSTESLIYYYYLKSVYNMAYFDFVVICCNFIRICAIGSPFFFSENETRLRIDNCLCYA